MTVDQADILKRIDELLITDTREKVAQLPHGGVSLLSLVYGEDSIQVKHFRARLADISRQHENHIRRENAISNEAIGALKNLKREIEAGLTGSLRQQVTGEVLTDFIQLARAVLNQQTDGAKNVAAVLAAAAFEDTIRRMGATLAGVIRGGRSFGRAQEIEGCRSHTISTGRHRTILSQLSESGAARELGQDRA